MINVLLVCINWRCVVFDIAGVMTFVLRLMLMMFCINRCVFVLFCCGVTSNLFMKGEI